MARQSHMIQGDRFRLAYGLFFLFKRTTQWMAKAYVKTWQHTFLGHYWPTSETPFTWRFASGRALARFYECKYICITEAYIYFTDGITPSCATKKTSENVVCCLLHVIAYANDLFRHTDKQRWPRSDCSSRSSLILVHVVFYRDVLKD